MLNKILIIDDEKNIRLTISQCLENAGYEVETAISGEHGLEKFMQSKYDIVLLDMKMPGIDGIEVLRRIKARMHNQLVIIITAHGTIETAVEAMKLGALDYIRKPFTPDEIRSLIKRVLSRKDVDEKLAAESYEMAMEYAKGLMNNREFDKGYEYLQKALSMESRKPEPYNLLGVVLELKNDLLEALKMYRAALAVDPTYLPAKSNLERATNWNYTRVGINMGSDS